MTRFKICGLRDSDNAVVVAESGADFLGFNFVPGARRRLEVEDAKEIVAEYRRRRGQGGPELFGLFADQPVEEVNRILREVGLDRAQLCGNEPPDYWDQVEAPVVKQIKVRDDDRDRAVGETDARVHEIQEHRSTPMLDKYVEGHKGGTGRTFDWTIAAEVARDHDFLLAGGLTPENVGEAIATVAPWAVDVSSGVETEGVKDAAKIRDFAEAVKRADGVLH